LRLLQDDRGYRMTDGHTRYEARPYQWDQVACLVTERQATLYCLPIRLFLDH